MAFEATLEKARKKHFPIKIKAGIYAELVTQAEFYPFLRKNFNKVFKPHKNRLHIQPKPSKKAKEVGEHYFNNIHNDLILIKNKNGEILGWCVGETYDMRTFYMRNTGILPKNQGQGIYSRFLDKYLDYLKDLGYQRVNSQHHPDNPGILIPKLRAGFVLSGMEAREDFGMLVVMTKFLTSVRDKGWRQKFL